MSPKAKNDWRGELYRDEAREVARLEREMAKIRDQMKPFVTRLNDLRARRYRIQNRATVRVIDARAREAS